MGPVNPVESNYFQYLGNFYESPLTRPSANKNSPSQFPPEIDGLTNKENPTSAKIEKGKVAKECQACKRQKYVDVSNDPSVSFKTPTSLSPGTEAFAVAAHEGQHVANESGKAKREGREVVYQSVQL